MFAGSPNYAAKFDVNAFFRSGDPTGNTTYITSWIEPGATGTQYISAGANCWTLAESINFDAKKVMLMIGDSTWNWSTGPSNVLTCTPWLINKFWRDQGLDSSHVLKAYSGSNTNGHESYRAAGKYEFPQTDAIFYNLGINDAAQGVTTARHSTNGTTPVQDATQEAALSAYRTADQAPVAAAADPNILFCNFANSFDRTVAANYATSDGAAGTRIHLDDAGPTYSGTGLRQQSRPAGMAANLPGF
jgi:hypothetical protein